MSGELVYEHFPLPYSELPSGWEVTNVCSVATEISSGFPCGDHNSRGEGVPHIRPMNIDREGRFDLAALKHVAGDVPKELQFGDVLFNNTNSPELIGKTTNVRVIGRFAYSNHMTRIKLENGVESRFIARQLHYLWTCGYFRYRCANHVNQASLSVQPLSETVPILLAPSCEQTRIADTLDELFSELDAAVAALERVQKKLKRYRASVLKAAVEGALTEDWRAQHPDTEPASELLKRILAERRRRWEEDQRRKYEEKGKKPPKNWKDKYKEPVAPDTTDLPDLPEGWCWATLDQLLWRLRSGSAESSGREPSLFPVLRSSAVRHGVIDFSDRNYLQETQSQRADNYLHKDDFLITRLSGSVDFVGCTAVVAEEPSEPTQYPDRIFCGKMVAGIESRFVTYCFRLGRTRTKVEEAAKSTAGHQRISLSDLYPLVLPLPPQAEQDEIVDLVEAQLSVIDHTEADIDAKIQAAQSLRQSILRHAFTGKLEPQDPNDEPASELLKRIAAERDARAREKTAAKKNGKDKTKAKRKVVAKGPNRTAKKKARR